MRNSDAVLKKWINEELKRLTNELQVLLPGILSRHTFKDDTPNDLKSQELSLNAKIGSKHKEFMDIRNQVIRSEDEFVALWFKGMIDYIESEEYSKVQKERMYDFHQLICSDKELLEYTILFLKRTYWRRFEALIKIRPNEDDAKIWIGQNNASYGILITPYFYNGKWNNDNSEIRYFKPRYWTIGHILETGFVIPEKNEKIEFNSIEEYLLFFKNVLVRASGSKYAMEIANKYCQFVLNHTNPKDVPLLIPEFRYNGLELKHRYRLDFTIINPYTLEKLGFEFSPWSSHGYISNTKGKTQKEINSEAKSNFENEMEKHKSYYKKHNIFTFIYTDEDLKDLDLLFEDMKKYLEPTYENRLFLVIEKDRFVNYKLK